MCVWGGGVVKNPGLACLWGGGGAVCMCGGVVKNPGLACWCHTSFTHYAHSPYNHTTFSP